MSDTPLIAVAKYMRSVSARRRGPTDAALLAGYARHRDEAAFAELVHRHGPMVLGVCRRSVGPGPDADDAFQATFLALARGARRVRASVPGWLYRVAVRASRAARRRAPTAPAPAEVADRADPFAGVEWRDVRRALDDELGRLPEKWRAPLVLSYLEGLSRDEAAQQLGWSLRTFHRRLEEARAVLRKRLERRGLGPAILAAGVLSVSELRAQVPPTLARQAAVMAVDRTAVPESIRRLVPRAQSWGIMAMKTAMVAALFTGGAILTLGGMQPVAADPPAGRPTPPAVLALAPIKKERPPEDPLRKKVREAQDKGVAYLKNQQRTQSDDIWSWENDTLNLLQPGGSSSLAVLALLESGLKPDDETVARGLKYLRSVPPKHTYVVSLQTQAFCRANQKEDADRIKKNVQWLVDAAVYNGGNLEGWSYSGAAAGNRADNSNTRYAVSALYAAHKAGFKVSKEGFWQSVREHYIQTQTRDGGWTYAAGERGKPTHTMTVSGLLGLLEAKNILGKENEAAGRAAGAATVWLANNLQFTTPPHTFYNFDVIAALGRASERKDFGTRDKKREWYREGCKLLTGVKDSPGLAQKPGGEWQIKQAIDDFPVVSTSFALRFLASRPD